MNRFLVRIDLLPNYPNKEVHVSRMDKLAHHQDIYNTLSSLGLFFYYLKSVMNHLVHVIDRMMTKGFSGIPDRSSRVESSSEARTT